MVAPRAVEAQPVPIRPHSTPDLSTCLDERRLALGGVVLEPSIPDVQALQLAGWAASTKTSIAFVPIDPLTNLTALLPAALHVADMVASKQAGVVRGSRLHVGVVTQDYRVRGVYRSLQVRDAGGGRIPLRDVVPAATRGSDGVIRTLDSGNPAGWSTIFLSSIAEARRVRGLDLVVVDLPAVGDDQLGLLGIPSIVVGRDPTDPLLVAHARRDVAYAWERSDLQLAGPAPYPLRGRLAVIAAGSVTRVIRVDDDAIATAASLFWQDVGPLTRAARRSPIARELALLAWGLFHDLIGLAMPTRYLESAGTPLVRRLDAIERATRSATGDARDLYLPMTTAELRDIVRAVGDRPPKADALLRVLRGRLADRGELMLIARTGTLARAYSAFLSDNGFSRVRVVPISGLADAPPAAYAVLPGLAPAWARWVYASGVAAEIDVIAYGHRGEAPTEQFAEAEIARRAVEFVDSMRGWLARPAQKAATWHRLSGEANAIADDRPDPPDSRAASERVEVVDLSPPDMPAGLWAEAPWLVTSGPGVAPRPGESGDADMADVDIPAVSVTFTDGRSAILARDGRVTRFLRAKGVPEPGYPVARLTPGDEVVFIDRDSRKDQLAKVLEVADQVPELAVASGWVTFWRATLARAYSEFGTYEALAEALRAEGCSLQTQSVRLWVVGQTIGPDDPEDVRRLGAALGDTVMSTHHKDVYRAIESLRRAHQRLGQRLGALARQVGALAAAGAVAADEVIDERSGLTAADFADSIEIVKVAAVEAVGDVPFIVTGRLVGQEPEELSDAR